MLIDAAGIAWYSNFLENTLGRLDPLTGAHTEFTSPTIKPGAPTGSLGMDADRDGNWWLALLRLQPATGKSIEYLPPRQTNVRRVFVDNSTTPVTFRVGSNHGASVVRLTPLD